MRGMPDKNVQVTAGGQVMCEDGVARPQWVLQSEQLQDYYDHEWGRPVITEHGLLERIVLEGFQSGLSWSLLLSKRRDFRSVFYLFDATRIAAMSSEEREKALNDPRLIRNPQKHAALYKNAEATIALREDPRWQVLPEDAPARAVLKGAANRLAPGLPVLVWSFVPEVHERPRHVDAIASKSVESEALAKELRKAGFSFVGPVTVYALMQAVGMVNDRVLEPGQ